jgi:hypothetical protein
LDKSGEEEIYSVPPEVLQSISKNFSELQQEFEKADADKTDVGDACSVGADADASIEIENRPKRFLRIKRVKSFGDQPPKGTVARILIQVNTFPWRHDVSSQ